MNDNPYMNMTSPSMVFLSLGIGCAIIALIIVVRWLFSRDAWAFHPQGAKGFLVDEFLRLGAIFIPFALTIMAVKLYVGAYHPEFLQSPYMPVFFLTIFLFRRLAASIPFVKAAGQRIDDARTKAIDAKLAKVA